MVPRNEKNMTKLVWSPILRLLLLKGAVSRNFQRFGCAQTCLKIDWNHLILVSFPRETQIKLKCGWPKLDKIERIAKRLTWKAVARRFTSLSPFSLKQVVNNKIRLRNHLRLLFKWDSNLYLIFHSHVLVQSSWTEWYRGEQQKIAWHSPFKRDILWRFESLKIVKDWYGWVASLPPSHAITTIKSHA